MSYEIFEVVMPPELLNDIRAFAKEKHLTQQGLIRKAVMEYIYKEKNNEQ